MDGDSNTNLLDAVGCIEIHGFARDNDGNQIMLRVSREDSLPAPTLIASHPALIGKSYHAELPPLPPSPPKGDTVLSLSVVEEVYKDEHATVYKVSTANKDKSDFFVPPLVIKVAARLDGRRVAEEGGVYDALRPLQGVVAPRCYGYFRSKINHQEMTIKPWDPECDHEQLRPQLDIFDMPNVAASLNILLLEKVGLSPDLKGIPLQNIEKELIDIHEELIPLAVLFGGTRLEKVRLAPPGLPGLPSSKHNRIYKWRLVGFGEAVRTSLIETQMKEEIVDCVNQMMERARFNGETL